MKLIIEMELPSEAYTIVYNVTMKNTLGEWMSTHISGSKNIERGFNNNTSIRIE